MGGGIRVRLTAQFVCSWRGASVSKGLRLQNQDFNHNESLPVIRHVRLYTFSSPRGVRRPGLRSADSLTFLFTQNALIT